jgi:ATP-dependent Zn protease
MRDKSIPVGGQLSGGYSTTLLSAAPVESVTILKNAGQTIRPSAVYPSAVYQGTLCEFEDEMIILLGGRTAERILLGDISAGAGGGDGNRYIS